MLARQASLVRHVEFDSDAIQFRIPATRDLISAFLVDRLRLKPRLP